MNEQQRMTLKDLSRWVTDWEKACLRNDIDPSDVEVFIMNNLKKYRPFSGELSYGQKGVNVYIEYFDSDIVRFCPKDERPETGEYWKSRGVSDGYDVSGFISSKAAGERLLRMVKYILDTDEPKTYLDYREFEPNWIQFKFSAEEFDVYLLDDLARANGHVVTEQIIRQCVRRRED